MESWLIWLLLGLGAAVVVTVATGRYRIMRDITRQLLFILYNDTNALIRIPPSGKQIRQLCSALNQSLRDLRAKELRLKQGDRELQEALRAWSHDLRTPLTAVTGYVELLSREDLSANARKYLDIVERRMHVLEEITEELFAFALLHSEYDSAPIERLNLVAVVEETAASFYDTFSQQGLDVDLQLPDRPVYIAANHTATMRVLYNLFSNALKYGTSPISVTLHANGGLDFANAAPRLDPLEAASLLGNNLSVPHFSKRSGTGLLVIRRLMEKMRGGFKGSLDDGILRIQLQFPVAPAQEEKPPL